MKSINIFCHCKMLRLKYTFEYIDFSFRIREQYEAVSNVVKENILTNVSIIAHFQCKMNENKPKEKMKNI